MDSSYINLEKSESVEQNMRKNAGIVGKILGLGGLIL
jgi:hypothetical protein